MTIGNNELARARLNRLLEHINNRCENHPELSTLLNLIGLTEQRGNNNLDSALKWYRLSYNERMYLYKVNPENLLAVLNNIAMILLEQGKLEHCIKYLNQALDIRRECGWRHYYTALTLTHLCEVYMKCDNFPEAFKKGLEAEKILKLTAKEHDMRLRINFTLAHIRVVLRQRMEPESAREEAFGFGGHEDLRNIHDPVMTPAGQDMNVPNFQDLMTDSENYNSLNASFRAYSTDGYNPRCFQQAPSQNVPMGQGVRTSPAPSFPSTPLTTTEIDPSDLSMTASDFLECGVSIHQDSSGLSDDGHKNYLASQTHNMVLNWGDHARLAELKDTILEYIRRNEKIEQSVFKSPEPLNSRYELLRQQAPLYYYIRDTPVEQLDLSTFLRLMVGSCHICAYVKTVYTEEMWRREAAHLVFTRQERERFIQEFDHMRLDPHFNDNLNLSSQTAAAADVSFKSPTFCMDSNKFGNGCVSKMVKSQDFHSHIQENQSLAGAENVSSFLDSPFYQFHSVDNNLSPQVESPKIIEEQKQLLLQLTRQNPHDYGAVGGLNIVQPEFDNNLATKQEKVSLGSKVIGIVREPIEQSEDDSLFIRNDLPPDEYAHPADRSRYSAGLRGHHLNQPKYLPTNHLSRNAMDNVQLSGIVKEQLKYQYYPVEHSTNQYDPPNQYSPQCPISGHKKHLLQNPEPLQPSLADVRFPPTESQQETSAAVPQFISEPSESPFSQFLKKAWPLLTEKGNQNLNTLSDTSKSSPSQPSQFVQQYLKDILNPVNCPLPNLDPDNNNNSANVDTKGSNNVGVSMFHSVPHCLAGKQDPPEGQASSLAESGFAGSSLCSSEDDPQHQVASRNMLSHSSHVTNESGYASGGAVPKTTRVNKSTDDAPRNPSCVVERNPKHGVVNSIDGGFEHQESFTSHPAIRKSCTVYREPCESCELPDGNTFNSDREPGEDSWCDTIVSGQCSGENFITVVPNLNQRSEGGHTSGDHSVDRHIHNSDTSSTSGD
ncbi:hypothetical protein Btru_057897 [Bulinus truncatus]|nr:hypothetical protein Btru_057897 [Bulinus truncatus]